MILCVGMSIAREGTAAMLGVLMLLSSAIWLAVVAIGLRGVYGFGMQTQWELLILNPFALSFLTREKRRGRMSQPWD